MYEIAFAGSAILYDVDEPERKVTVKAVGVKRHNMLFIRGREYRL